MELADHVLHKCEVLCGQPFTLFRQVSFVLHAIAQGTTPVLALVNHLELLLLLTVYFNGRQWFRRCTPVGYVRLQQQEVEDIVNAASLLRKLQAIDLHAYLLYNWVGSVEPMVELLAWTLRSDVFA